VIFVVLPAFNEESNIELLLKEICHSMAESAPHRDVTIVVVDDGSTDQTPHLVARFEDDLAAARTAPGEADPGSGVSRVTVTLLRLERNQGLAEAVKTGLNHCAGRSEARDIILTMDADNSHTPGLIPSMVRLIQEGRDVVIASRYQPGARVIGLSRSRQFLSWGASVLLRVLFPIPSVRDYTCGFRAYRATLIQRVLASNPHFISERGFTVMVDILLKLRTIRPEVMMTELPILLRYDRKIGASKMNVPRTIFDTLGLIWRRLRGRP